MSAPPLIVHATPPLQPLPASDTRSLYLIALLQLQNPGRWALTTGDWGENGGSLPYLTHLGHHLPISHIHSIPAVPDPDEGLSREDRAEALTWVGYIENTVTDLIHHSLYSLPPNYPATIGKAHLTGLAFPQSQYIPQRLRGIHKARLQHVGLWGLGGMNDSDLADEDRKRLDDLYVQGPGGTVAPRAWSGWQAGREYEERRRKRGEEELVKRAKSVFEPLDRRLGSRPYFFGSKPTTPDLELFANLTLILDPTLPNPLLPTLIKFHYPNLVSHHDRLLALLFPGPTPWSSVPMTPPPETTRLQWYEYLVPAGWLGDESNKSEKKEKEKKELSKKEKAFQRGRWLWFAGAGVAMVAYIFGSGLVSIEFGGEDEDVIEEISGDDGNVQEEIVIVEEEEE